MPYEFLIKNGLINQGNITSTGTTVLLTNVTTGSLEFSGLHNRITMGYGSIYSGGSFGDFRILTDRFRLYNITGSQIALNVDNNGKTNWYISGSNKMVLDSVGLGIGTTLPSSALHVVEATNTGSRIQLGSTSTSSLMSANSTNDLLILNAPYGPNADTTSNKGAKWGIKFVGSIDTSYPTRDTNTKTSAIYAVSEDVLGYNRGTSLAFYTNAWNDQPYTERMRIYHDGNVGIGTTTPGSRLEVQFPTNPAVDNGAGNNVLRVWTSASFDADVGGAIGLGGTYNTSSYQSFGQIAGRKTNSSSGSNAGYLQFATTNNGGTMNEWMRIDAGGHVGIGTSVPDIFGRSYGKILGISGSNAAIELNSDSGSNSYFDMGVNGIRIGNLQATSTTFEIGTPDNIPLHFYTTGSYKMTILPNGNVGIGSTLPTAMLDVYGDTRVGTTTSNYHDFTGSVNITGSLNITGSQSIVGNIYMNNNNIEGINTLIINDPGPREGILWNGGYGWAIYESPNDLTSNTAGNLQFISGSGTDTGSANVRRLTLNTDGNSIFPTGSVGIGTDFPISKLNIYGSGSNLSVLKVDGANGTLFEVTDNLIGSLFSVNSISGIPILEVFSDNTIIGGKYNANDFVITGSNIGIGIRNPIGKLHVTSSTSFPSGIFEGGNVGIGTTNPGYTLQIGQNTSGSNIDYNLGILRHGTLTDPGTWTSVPAIKIIDLTSGGPSSVDANGVFNIEMPRFEVNDVSASNATIVGITYDTAMGPLRIDGKGNTWIGYDRVNAFTSSNSYSTLIYNGLTVGSSYQTASVSSGTGIFSDSVGIGTASPRNQLTVIGPAQNTSAITDSGNTGGTVLIASSINAFNQGGTLLFSTLNDSGSYLPQWGIKTLFKNGTGFGVSDLAFSSRTTGSATSLTEHVRFLYNGNVGIGTSNPDTKLKVVTGALPIYNRAVRFDADISTNPSQYTQTLQLTDETNLTGSTSLGFGYYTHGLIKSRQIGAVDSSGGLDFYTRTDAGPPTEKMTIINTGNVGIGITAPIAKLHLTGSTTEQMVRIESDAEGGNYPQLYIEGNKSGSAAAISTQIQLVSNIDFRAKGITFYNKATSPRWFAGVPYQGASFQIGYDALNGLPHYKISSSIYIQDNGNVGIGNATPASKLDVTGDINVYYNSNGTNRVWRTFATNHTSSNRGATLLFGMYDGSPAGMNVVNTGSSNPSYNSQYVAFLTHEGGVNADERMRITPMGNVGIGVTNPLGRLHITGSITNGESLIYLSKGSGSISQNFITAVNEINQASYRVTSDINGYTQQTLYRNGTSYVYHDAYWSSWINNANYSQGGLNLGSSGLTHGYGLSIVRPAVSGSLYVSGSSRFTGSVNISGSTTSKGVISDTQISTTTGTFLSYVTPGIYSNGASTGNSIGILSNTTFANQGAIANLGLHQTGSNANDINAGVYLSLGGWYQNSGIGLPVYIGGGYTSNSSSILSVVPTDTAGNGNVGIGTRVPSSKFEVNTPTAGYSGFTGGSNVARFNALAGTGAATSLLLTNYVGDLNTDTTVDLDFAAVDVNSVLGSYPHARIGYTGYYNSGINVAPDFEARGYFRIATRTEGSAGILTDKMVIDYIGNTLFLTGSVGIGVTSSIATLDVDNTVTNIPILNLGGGPAANNISDLYVLNSYSTSSGVGYAAKVIGVNISGSLTEGNIPIQRTVWGGVTSATAIVLSADDPASGDQDNAFQIWTTNDGVAGTALTQKFCLNSSGSVGIGTTGPVTKLDVYTGNGISQIFNQIQLTNMGTPNVGDIVGIGFAAGESTIYGVKGSIGFVRTTNYGRGALTFYTNNTAGTETVSTSNERMRIEAGGNVGIGTTSPVARLSVVTSGSSFETTNTMVAYFGKNTSIVGGGGSSFIRVSRLASETTTGSNAEYTDIEHNSAYGSPFRYGTYNDTNIINGAAATNGLYGSINFVTSGSTRMTVAGGTSAGYVGVGTTSPVTFLDVVGGNGSFPTSSGTIQATGSIVRLRNRDSNLVLDIGGNGGNGNWLQSTSRADLSLGYPLLLNPNGGNVGVGTTSPNYRFEVLAPTLVLANQPNIIANFKGETDGRSLIRVDNTYASAGAAALQAGISFVAYSNSSNQPSSNKHEAQIILGSTGANSVGQTGTLQIVAPLDIAFNVSASNTIMTGSSYATFGSNAMYLSRTGNVGVGTTSPGALFEISSSTVASLLNVKGAGGNGILYVTGSGFVGINTVSPIAALDVRGRARVQSNVAGNTGLYVQQDDGTGDVVEFYRSNTSNFILKSGGNVGIGTNTPGAKLEITGSSASSLFTVKSPVSSSIVFVSGSGNVGINTSTPAYTLQVNGSFGATTKSFVIEHPTKQGKKLVYGSLESPYHGVRLTGKGTVVNGKCKVELPDYINKLVLHDSVNVQLTGIKCGKVLFIDDINIPENYFTVTYDKSMFERHKNYEFFWDFTATRADVPELITEL